MSAAALRVVGLVEASGGGSLNLSYVLDHALSGIMLGLHDIRERGELAVLLLHVLLQIQVLQVERLVHFLKLLGR